MKKPKYVIVSLRQTCGGPIALHALCKHIQDMGYDASVFYVPANMRYVKGQKALWLLRWIKYTVKDAVKYTMARFAVGELGKSNAYQQCYILPPVRGCKRKYVPFVGKNVIVVYPETIHGNFLHASKVVRWLLYHHDYPQEVCDAYSENDLFVAYRDVFNDKELNPEGFTVQTPYFDMDLYKRYNYGERKGKCYIIRKGTQRPDLPAEFDGVIIDGLPEKEIVRIFNECEYCISYDTQTSYSEIAAICGCVSVIIPEKGKRKEDYRPNDEPTNGIAWGFSENEISRAVKTQHLVEGFYHNLNEKSRESAANFVKICEDYFE